MSIDYSPWIEPTGAVNEPVLPKFWLVSGSRDRLTQIYEIKEDSYENVTILEDHSSSITSVRFEMEKGLKDQKRLKLITCGADKQIVYRNMNLDVIGSYNAKDLVSMNSDEFSSVQKKELCKNRIFSMDIN